MNANLEELLRDGMERFTADLRAPANLANQARRRRGQRLVFRTAASCAAAAIAVAAIAVGIVSARTAMNRPAGPVERSDVEYVRLTGPGQGRPEMIWSYGRMSRQLITSSSGRPLEDDGVSVLGSEHSRLTLIRTIVEFGSKTWARA